jgi:hypothetical protein
MPALIINAGNQRSGQRREFAGCGCYLWGQNPDLGVATPRPPVEERFALAFVPRRFNGGFILGFPQNKKPIRQRIKKRNAAPQTPLRKVQSGRCVARFALVLGLWI